MQRFHVQDSLESSVSLGGTSFPSGADSSLLPFPFSEGILAKAWLPWGMKGPGAALELDPGGHCPELSASQS